MRKRNIILFVDDEKICHTLVDLIIPNFTNFKVVSAYNGKEAIDLAKRYSNEICLVLSDVILPDINGYEIFNAFKNDDKLAKIPFLFQTGLGNQEQILKENIGKDVKIIYKPYKQNELIKSINDILDNPII